MSTKFEKINKFKFFYYRRSKSGIKSNSDYKTLQQDPYFWTKFKNSFFTKLLESLKQSLQILRLQDKQTLKRFEIINIKQVASRWWRHIIEQKIKYAIEFIENK